MKQNGRDAKKIMTVSVTVMIIATVLPAFQASAISQVHARSFAARQSSHSLTRDVPGAHGFVRYKADSETLCREASNEEVSRMRRQTRAGSMRIISDTRRKQSLSTEATGLQITLRGTAQLESFPAAKAAFLSAAASWASHINSSISIVIDVDFGPTWFGETYDENILGQTDSQDLGDSTIYPDLRNSLIAGTLNAQEGSLYSLLPDSRIPTDIGNTTYVIAPSASWRALGFIDPVADPDAEEQSLGNPPAIGFNSAFDYDFDPTDGIDSNKVDFDAVAVHEIGHALGFVSNTGYRELDRTSPIAVTVWDIFRFRSGTTLDTFQSASRILSSGGQQYFFTGSADIALSTGRPDGTGGDREQSSHWKDDRLTGRYIGIMDPTIGDGERQAITDNDLTALRIFGYLVDSAEATPDPPVISSASFNGKKLKITGKRFKGQFTIQINGQMVLSTLNVSVNSSAKKIQIKASSNELNLRSGPNEIVVTSNGAQSNIFILSL